MPRPTRHTTAAGRNSTIRLTAELLEPRRLLHAGPGGHDLLDGSLAGLPDNVRSLFGHDGHIDQFVYANLPARYQRMIDPHFVADRWPIEQQQAAIVPRPGEATGDEPTLALAQRVLPDFVPRLTQSPFLDTTSEPGRTLVRFGTGVQNHGLGPAILVGGPVVGSAQVVFQRTYTWTPGPGGTGGTLTNPVDREAGRFIFHPGHGHLHFEGYAAYRLLANVGGQPGPIALRSDGSLAAGEKVGFCLINVNSSFTLPGGASSTTIPSYFASGQPNTGCGQLQGVHIGKEDVYSAGLDGQWIDITGVAPGNYFIELQLDAMNAVEESNESNNTILVPYNIINPSTPGTVIDRFDQLQAGGPNNSFDRATSLGVAAWTTESGLTVHSASDDDFFSFVASSSGSYPIDITFSNGDLDLFLYDSQRRELGRSTNASTGSTANPRTETITAGFIAGQRYFALVRGYNEDLSNNYQFRTRISLTAAVAAPDAAAGEVGPDAAEITLQRNGSVANPIRLNFTVGGTATRGVDYNLVYDGNVLTANTLLIGTLSALESLRIVPIADTLVEPNETVILSLSAYVPPTPPAQPAFPDVPYVIGTGSVTVTLGDTPPVVTATSFDIVRNTVSFDFSLDVSASLAAGDLLVRNTTTDEAFAPAQVTWDAVSRRAAFRMGQPLSRGTYTGQLPAASVTHAQGVPLAAPGNADFSVLPADATLDGRVDLNDLLLVARNFGLSGQGWATGDFTYDGLVGFADMVILGRNYNLTIGSVPLWVGSPLTRTAAPRRTASAGLL